MLTRFRSQAFLITLGLILGGATAADADMIQVSITNDDIEDVFVTVTDLNTQTPTPVLTGERLNSHASKVVSITADGNGRGHLSWAATRVPGTTGCGSGESKDLNAGDTVSVTARGDCTEALKRKALGKKT